ncbi:putative nucleic acid-binding protein [Neorhizobium galegae]|uniref:type II toxin-antitoxin system VapC family toxin n=1 Tax=Neorhizobium galegae TaxID=399 RepID=UPI0027825005|nr:type II toxin-antitoxin system VapC family toxin [Neorhizobium galegae]MDQ0132171.1 putative nucleic acid-binding protein [Neorhizobium galegae]
MTDKVYVDSNIFIYYVDGRADLKLAARECLSVYFDDGTPLFSSDVTLGECLRGVRAGDRETAAAFLTVLEDKAFICLVDLTRSIIKRAAALGAELNIKLIDAIHLATAEALQCGVFLTNDRGIRAPASIELRYLSAEA